MGELIVCKNCGNQFEGNFCNNCSQPSNTQAIDLRFIWHDLQHGLLHFNNKIFYTIVQLFTRPGHSIREFIEGKRLRHFQPFSFVIVLAGLYGGVFHVLGIDILNNVDGSHGTKEESQIIVDWLLHHFAIVQLICIPVFTLATYLSFKKWGGTFLEYLVVNAFLTCQRLLLHILLLPVLYHYSATSTSGRALNVMMLVTAIFGCWTFVQYFKGHPIKQIILRTILAYFVGMVGLALVLLIAIGLYIALK